MSFKEYTLIIYVTRFILMHYVLICRFWVSNWCASFIFLYNMFILTINVLPICRSWVKAQEDLHAFSENSSLCE